MKTVSYWSLKHSINSLRTNSHSVSSEKLLNSGVSYFCHAHSSWDVLSASRLVPTSWMLTALIILTLHLSVPSLASAASAAKTTERDLSPNCSDYYPTGYLLKGDAAILVLNQSLMDSSVSHRGWWCKGWWMTAITVESVLVIRCFRIDCNSSIHCVGYSNTQCAGKYSLRDK